MQRDRGSEGTKSRHERASVKQTAGGGTPGPRRGLIQSLSEAGLDEKRDLTTPRAHGVGTACTPTASPDHNPNRSEGPVKRWLDKIEGEEFGEDFRKKQFAQEKQELLLTAKSAASNRCLENLEFGKLGEGIVTMI